MAPRTKILYLIERLARASTELHLLRILERLDRERYEPVLCVINSEASESALVPPGIPLRSLDAGWNLMHPREWKLPLRLRRVLLEERPAIVHTFLFVANVLAPFVGRFAGRPRIVVSRDRMGIEWQANALHRLAQRAADRRTNLILCKTEAMLDEIARTEGVLRRRMRVVPNGVDTERYKPVADADARRAARELLAAEHGIPATGPLLLAMGNLKPVKDQRTLVVALRLLRAKAPDARVAIIGQGESEPYLRGEIAQLELGEHAFLPGHAEDVRPWLHAADLFVATSVSEGMPNAVLEAMASGLPLVLSDLAGHREAAAETAQYFKPGDGAALARVLMQALAQPEEFPALGGAARRRAETDLSIAVAMERIESAYRDVLEMAPI